MASYSFADAFWLNQGYRICLNGHEVYTYTWWQSLPYYAPMLLLSPENMKFLEKRANAVAIYANAAYPNQQTTVADTFGWDT